jgi:hypothetical protein
MLRQASLFCRSFSYETDLLDFPFTGVFRKFIGVRYLRLFWRTFFWRIVPTSAKQLTGFA